MLEITTKECQIIYPTYYSNKKLSKIVTEFLTVLIQIFNKNEFKVKNHNILILICKR